MSQTVALRDTDVPCKCICCSKCCTAKHSIHQAQSTAGRASASAPDKEAAGAGTPTVVSALPRTWICSSSTVVAEGSAFVMFIAACCGNTSRRRAMSLTPPWSACSASSLLSSSRRPPARLVKDESGLDADSVVPCALPQSLPHSSANLILGGNPLQRMLSDVCSEGV